MFGNLPKVSALSKNELDVSSVDTSKNEKDFSDDGLWDKFKGSAKKIGSALGENALILYYATESDKCEVHHKVAIYGALGDLISPIDAVSDLVPIVGYTDDTAVIAAAVAGVAKCIDEKVKSKAKNKITDIFG